MNIELSSTPDLRLTRAILIYSSSRDDVAATDHNVVGSQIQPGRPLDLDAFREHLASAKTGNANADDFTYTHPNMIAESRGYRVWFTNPQDRKLFIKGVPRQCYIPALIWCGHKSKRSLFVWAFEARGNGLNGAPWGETILYRPQLSHHVHPDGNVCLGNMNTADCQPESWMKGFYETSFQDPIPSKQYEITKQAAHGTLKDALAMVTRLEARDRSTH